MRFKKGNKRESKLSIEYTEKAQNLFRKKGWPINNDNFFSESVFDRFCKMLEPLSDEQRELMLLLTKDFLWVAENEYIKLFTEAFNSMINKRKSWNNNVCICPLLPEEDFGKVKSSFALLYLIKSRMSAIKTCFPSHNIYYIDMPNNIPVSKIENGATLCLIDDFIGTGETAEGALQYCIDEKGLEQDRICVVSLVSMITGINRIQEKGIEVFSAKECRKGISNTNDADSKRIIMEAIEKEIKVNEKNSFGYGKSEALVKMIRTPNNTFPIYWLDNSYNCAPFPR